MPPDRGLDENQIEAVDLCEIVVVRQQPSVVAHRGCRDPRVVNSNPTFCRRGLGLDSGVESRRVGIDLKRFEMALGKRQSRKARGASIRAGCREHTQPEFGERDDGEGGFVGKIIDAYASSRLEPDQHRSVELHM